MLRFTLLSYKNVENAILWLFGKKYLNKEVSLNVKKRKSEEKEKWF